MSLETNYDALLSDHEGTTEVVFQPVISRDENEVLLPTDPVDVDDEILSNATGEVKAVLLFVDSRK